MGRNKNNHALATAAASRSAKERHLRSARETITVPHNLVVLPEKNIKSKHQSYFQFFENKDRKDKKLEFEVTTDTNPPPGFEFVPIGNPELTNACKELSREQEAMIFIVSAPNDAYTQHDENVKKLALQVHRMGHHIRRTIVEQARAQIGQADNRAATDSWQLPETQEEINAQAEAAIRDLFPRIPNFDRQMIIEHSFRKGQGYGKPKVGTSDLPLHRRVQLAVLAHIRHTHTRYDHLLKEADWHIARKAVEKTCLDILVKWRGDEETGRDQLDDILREVVVISDESDDSEDSQDSDSDSGQDEEDYSDSSVPDTAVEPVNQVAAPRNPAFAHKSQPKRRRQRKMKKQQRSKQPGHDSAQPKPNPTSKKDKRGFRRYEAAQATMTRRWEEAISRHRHDLDANPPAQAARMSRIPSQTIQRQPSVEIVSPVHRAETRQNNHVVGGPQPLYRTGDDQDQRARSGDVYTTNTYRGNPQMSAPGRSASDLDSSQGTVIGRRVGHFPIGIRGAAAPERHFYGELRDFLVPSIEPVSPQSGPGRPHFVRPIVREQMRPEQVPKGGTRSYDTRGPLESQPRAVEHYQRPPVEHNMRRSLYERLGDSGAQQSRFHYGAEVRSHANTDPPREVTRVYRVREPIDEIHRPAENTMGSATRVIRVHRETRPTEIWAAEPGRIRELSPHRVDGRSARPMASPVHENVERRHVMYREASVSRFQEPFQNPGLRTAHPPSYEVRPAAPPISWQGRTFTEPAAQQAAFSGAPYDGPPRRPANEPVPMHQLPPEYYSLGRPHHEGTYPSHSTRALPPGRPGYLYEQQAQPPRDPEVIIIR